MAPFPRMAAVVPRFGFERGASPKRLKLSPLTRPTVQPATRPLRSFRGAPRHLSSRRSGIEGNCRTKIRVGLGTSFPVIVRNTGEFVATA